jgi:hypothetical protein
MRILKQKQGFVMRELIYFILSMGVGITMLALIYWYALPSLMILLGGF